MHILSKTVLQKDQKLSTVMTTDAGETIRNCANRKGDVISEENMRRRSYCMRSKTPQRLPQRIPKDEKV